jgi:spore coat protein SA
LLRRIFAPLLRRIRHGDIVWIHNRPEFALALTPTLHQAGAQVVLHMHNSHLVEWPTTLVERVRVDRIVFVSQFLLDEAQRKFPRLPRAEVLYNGADGVIFHRAETSPAHLPAYGEATEAKSPVVLFAGRLVKDKGVHVLVESMRLLSEQGIALRAWIVGGADFSGGQQTEYIERLKAAAPETVSFLPYRTGASLGELFRQADIFCSPSVWDEPFGMVNVEALASGLPVVSTRVGGVPEVFREGGGILVERGSSQELADALRLLAQDQELRSQLARQGYETFTRRFTWSVARSRVHEVLRSLPI